MAGSFSREVNVQTLACRANRPDARYGGSDGRTSGILVLFAIPNPIQFSTEKL